MKLAARRQLQYWRPPKECFGAARQRVPDAEHVITDSDFVGQALIIEEFTRQFQAVAHYYDGFDGGYYTFGSVLPR